MRTFLAVAAAMACMGAAAEAQPVPASELIAEFDARLARGEAIVGEIGAMHARDQFVRRLIMQGFQREMTGEARQAYIEGTRHHFDRIDGANSDRLQELLREISWAELVALSPAAGEQAFSLISHSNDTAFKRRMIAAFEPLARAGQMPGDRFAMLVDDVAMEEQRPQVYGTNFRCLDGVYQPHPTEAMDQLNARRAAIGLNSIEEYTASVRSAYGACPPGYTGN